MIGMSIQPPRQQRLEMAGTQIHLHRMGRVKRIRQITNRALLLADETAMLLGADDERLALSLGQGFLTVRTHRMTGEAVPRTAGGLAATARRSRSQLLHHDAQPLHRSPSRSRPRSQR